MNKKIVTELVGTLDVDPPRYLTECIRNGDYLETVIKQIPIAYAKIILDHIQLLYEAKVGRGKITFKKTDNMTETDFYDYLSAVKMLSEPSYLEAVFIALVTHHVVLTDSCEIRARSGIEDVLRFGGMNLISPITTADLIENAAEREYIKSNGFNMISKTYTPDLYKKYFLDIDSYTSEDHTETVCEENEEFIFDIPSEELYEELQQNRLNEISMSVTSISNTTRMVNFTEDEIEQENSLDDIEYTAVRNARHDELTDSVLTEYYSRIPEFD